MKARPRGPVVSTQSEYQTIFVGFDGVGAHIEPAQPDDHRDSDPLTTAQSTTFAATAAANNLVEPLLALADQFLKISRPVVAFDSSQSSFFETTQRPAAHHSEQVCCPNRQWASISIHSELIQGTVSSSARH